jgi:predicted acyltransferase (DUF342 family)
MALANVTLTNTFDEWRVRTNQIIYKQDELEGNVANSLIAMTSNVANALNYANTAFLSKAQGGTVSGNVLFSGVFANVTSNVNVSGNTRLTGNTVIAGNTIIANNLTFAGPFMNIKCNVASTGAGDIIIDLLG